MARSTQPCVCGSNFEASLSPSKCWPFGIFLLMTVAAVVRDALYMDGGFIYWYAYAWLSLADAITVRVE